MNNINNLQLYSNFKFQFLYSVGRHTPFTISHQIRRCVILLYLKLNIKDNIKNRPITNTTSNVNKNT